jgi:hypothetical protein
MLAPHGWRRRLAQARPQQLGQYAQGQWRRAARFRGLGGTARAARNSIGAERASVLYRGNLSDPAVDRSEQ